MYRKKRSGSRIPVDNEVSICKHGISVRRVSTKMILKHTVQAVTTSTLHITIVKMKDQSLCDTL